MDRKEICKTDADNSTDSGSQATKNEDESRLKCTGIQESKELAKGMDDGQKSNMRSPFGSMNNNIFMARKSLQAALRKVPKCNEKGLSSANETKITETKSEVRESIFLDHIKEIGGRKQNLDLTASKSQQHYSLDIERTAPAVIVNVNELAFGMQCFEFYLKHVKVFGHKALKTLPKLFSKNFLPDSETELKEPSLTLQISKYIEELKKKLETRSTTADADSNANVFQLNISMPNFKDFLKQQKDLELGSLELQRLIYPINEKTVTESKMEIDKSNSLLQDPYSEDQSKLKELETVESPEIINLKSDENITFQFDELGKEQIWVNDVYYVLDETQKITFNIGNGNAQLSFIGSKVSISTQTGQIDCSMQRNNIVFSYISNSKPKPVSFSEGPEFRNVSKSVSLPEGRLPSNATKPDPFPESKTALQVQKSLDDLLQNFCTDVKTACADFENSFLKSLKSRIDDTFQE